MKIVWIGKYDNNNCNFNILPKEIIIYIGKLINILTSML
jgi:hypothetical protein